MTMNDTVLRISGLSKSFGSVRALDNVDFELRRGEVHALLGMNGAGKSTLTKILSGIYTPDAGEIKIDGKKTSITNPSSAMRAGIAAVQQHPELVPAMTCYENVLLGQESAKPGLFRRVDRSKMLATARATAERYEMALDLESRVSDLSPVEKELLSILHALIRDNTKVLLLDEPTSILTEAERDMLFALMRTLCDQGISIIYITHHLEEVFEITDRFTVFRNGQRVATMDTLEAKAEGVNLAELMLGRPLKGLYPAKAAIPEIDRKPVIKLEKLSADQMFSDVTLEARRGEVLGIFGLVGSGIHELGDAIYGIRKHDGQGRIWFKSKETNIRSAGEALKKGIFLLPGDRRTQGLVMERSSVFNTTLANLKRSSNRLGLDRVAANRRDADAILTKLDLNPHDIDISASSFSGGNQQKVVMAKALYSDSELYIFVEPTVGVDVGARSKIYSEIRKLADEKAVVLISSDCDEVFGLSDRAVSFYKRQQVGDPEAKITRDQLLHRGLMGEANQ
jgi:ABC-type sugar transport system ATPase subunit